VAVLFQVGEEKLVLEIGQAALQCPDSKLYDHDVLLAMALAEVRITQEPEEKLAHHRFFDTFLMICMHFVAVLYCKS
jgi:hypothetical protein